MNPTLAQKHQARMDALVEVLSGADRFDSIANFLSGLGDPSRDRGAAGRPTVDTRLNPFELEILYLQNDLAATIVDDIVDDALRKGVRVVTDSDDTEDPLEDLVNSLDVVNVLGDAAKWGRLYGAGFVLMVVNDGMEASAPLELERVNGVTQLIDLDIEEVTPARWQLNIMEPGFGEPDLYDVNPTVDGGVVEGLNGQRVHASRLLRFGGVRLPRKLRSVNQGYDDSVLQRPWDTIRRFVETEQAIANIIGAYQTTTITLSGLSAILQEDEGTELIRARMKLIAEGISMINAVLLDADGKEQLHRESSSVAGLSDLHQRFGESVSRSAKMPQTRLFGTAPAGMNTDGESGIQSWHKQVHGYQTKELEPPLRRLFRVLFAALGGEPDNWSVEWPALDEPSELEVAEHRKVVAETDALYLDRSVRTPDQVARSRDGVAGWSADTLPRDDVAGEELSFDE